MIRTAMARGYLVVDENVSELAVLLRDKNFRVVEPLPGMDDSAIIQRLLPGRILVTNNVKDFEFEATAHEFGIIYITQAALANPERAAARISRAFITHKLKTQTPFLLTVGVAAVQFKHLEE